MSIALQHSASAIATAEFKGKKEYARLGPKWIKEKQLRGYYNSMNIFFSESLDELTIPKRFNKKELLEFLMNAVKRSLNEDAEFRNLIIKLSENYPRFPIKADQASRYVHLLKTLSHHVARAGYRLNEEYASESYLCDIPYIIFSNLILGNYTISYFHEYNARATEQHFRRNYLLVRGRPNLRSRQAAIKSYFQMIKPTQKMFQTTFKSQFKLWLFIMLSNSKNIQDFAKESQLLSLKKMNQKQLEKLTAEHSEQLEKFRRLLFQLEPELFKPTTEIDEPTQTMWRDMVLLKITK